MDKETYFGTNRRNWDARTPGHLEAYSVEEFAANPDAISSVVTDDAATLESFLPGGSVRGLSLVHLQCHLGTDTVSWARLGATVTGLDFSPASVEAARRLAEKAGVAARFVEANVYDAARELGETYDVVYTSIGVLAWLPDLDEWARVVHRLLRPGGTFYIREGHPFVDTLAEREDDLLVVGEPYFGDGSAHRYDDAMSYTGTAIESDTATYQWTHSLSEVIQSLLDAGLELRLFREHTELPWKPLHFMVEASEGRWVLPEGRERLPLAFTVVAQRPA